MGYTRETSKSFSCIDVAYCSHVIEISILKTAIGDHYTIVFDLKMDIKLDSEVESVFQITLWNNFDDTLIASNLAFKLNHLWKKFFENQNKNNINSNFFQIHSLVNEVFNDTIIPTIIVYHKKRDKWVDNEVKNLAALKNTLYQEFLKEKSEIKKNKNTTKSETDYKN